MKMRYRSLSALAGLLLLLLAAALGIDPANILPAVRELVLTEAPPEGPAGGGMELIGLARVVDGDSLVVGGSRIRLHGIDAPEARQTCAMPGGRDYRCGERATAALREAIGGAPVRCTARDRDRYGRLVATCLRGTLNLNDHMVRSGWAVAYRSYSDAYVPAEAAARDGGLGIWAGQFEAPADWRRRQRRSPG